MSNFWKSILASDNASSSKRLVTLIIALHFIIASFATLFIAFYVVFYLPKGRVEISLLDMLKQIMEYDFYIILSGLGFITAENMGQIVLEKAKQKGELLATALQNQPPKVLVTQSDAKVTPITGDDLVITQPPSEEVEVNIIKNQKPE